MAYRKSVISLLVTFIGIGCLSAVQGLHAAQGFRDVLDIPAVKSPLAAKQLFNGIVSAGTRLVSVGQRGVILYSDDAGETWVQADVPVSADLTAVHFPTPQKGWAVGHDGIVLHSSDAGKTWVKQFDGRLAARMIADYYTKNPPADKSTASAEFMKNVKILGNEPAGNPFLDVFFKSESEGIVIGAFNLIFHTTDAGKTWEPWLERTENSKSMHLYAIRQIGPDIFIAGESGLILKMDQRSSRFRSIKTPYAGTFFGITGKPGMLVAFGLRGNVYQSRNGGGYWRKLDSGVEAGLTGGAVDAAGRVILVSQGGDVLVMKDDGSGFNVIKGWVPAAAVVAAGKDKVVIAGIGGMKTHQLKNR